MIDVKYIRLQLDGRLEVSMACWYSPASSEGPGRLSDRALQGRYPSTGFLLADTLLDVQSERN